MTMCVYISGPMSGIPQFNIPLFERTEEYLRRGLPHGAKIISPAKLIPAPARQFCLDSATGDHKDVEHVSGSYWANVCTDLMIITNHVTHVTFLPDWWTSKGARVEAYVALMAGVTNFSQFQPQGSWCAATDCLWTSDVLVALNADNIRATRKQFMP